ncbi:MAG: type II toxin-antitoxin system RelE/ParE family toxin [Bacteroidetes bacterium]|nr:type II toxin-antitoxin system RelE/ParE family toxin [Bacteroidota bacterium]MBS1741093.1 type II toxin-antitoxin system RelE/ParE family toxin [Bacteroidota bacterium]
MGYNVEFKKSAEKELAALPTDIIAKMRKAILSLKVNPLPTGSKKLKGRKNDYRIRVGNYRVVYQIKNEVLIVYVIKIGHRKDIYK